MTGNHLATVDQAALPAILTADIASARHYLAAEKADSTRRAYRTDWTIFTSYCAERGLEAMPAHPDAVITFLSAQADSGVKASTLSRRFASIRYAHKTAGHEPPTNAESVRAVMRGIRRTIGTATTQKTAATADIVRQMLDACPDSLKGKRDRAVLALGFAGAFRRSELAALTVADLIETPDGLRITIAKSKTDQTGEGQTIAILRGTKLRPVDAVRDWLAASDITSGPIFRRISKGSKVGELQLTAESIADIVKAYATAIGADPASFGGHSLRAGFVTSGARAGVPLNKLMEVSRHRKVDTLIGYIRNESLFHDHAGASFL